MEARCAGALHRAPARAGRLGDPGMGSATRAASAFACDRRHAARRRHRRPRTGFGRNVVSIRAGRLPAKPRGSLMKPTVGRIVHFYKSGLEAWDEGSVSEKPANVPEGDFRYWEWPPRD